MPNKTFYLNEEDSTYVKENIKNFSKWISDKIKVEKDINNLN